MDYATAQEKVAHQKAITKILSDVTAN